MRILYLNPNSTAAMTEGVVAVARQAVPEAEIVGLTNHDGPPAIQGPADGAAAVPGLLAMAAGAGPADAMVVACADDIGLEALRAVAPVPVLGLAQSAFHMAALLGHRFSVVTTLEVSVPVIAENVARYGLSAQCLGVHASGIPVLEVEEGAPDTVARLTAAIAAAAARDGSGAVVLGCAGMAPLVPQLATGVPLIDGVAASALLAIAAARTRFV